MCLEEIGLRAQNMLTILSGIVNIIYMGGDMYDHLMSTRIFTLIMHKIFKRALKIIGQMTIGDMWIC